jgi:hypothetical protein
MRQLLDHAAENNYGAACAGRSRGPFGDATPELAGGTQSTIWMNVVRQPAESINTVTD